jgi:outer membrane lipoprotein-sorting protein
MKVWLDSELYLPVALQYVEADGDVTKYEFENYRVNGELPAGRFDLQLPRDVEIRNVEAEGRPALR